MNQKTKRIVVGITGASGVIYGIRLLEILKENSSIEVHLIVSEWAKQTIEYETKYSINEIMKLADYCYDNHNLAASISSGSFKVDSYIIIPCSMKSVSSIAYGLADNLITRVGDVTIKEKRDFYIVPRESPLSSIHLENMLKLSNLGVQIIPPIPSFYNKPNSIEELINQQMMRILDQMKIDVNNIGKRWS